MNVVCHSRVVPASILAACLLAGGVYAILDARRAANVAGGAPGAETSLEALEAVIGRGEADETVWRRYAELRRERKDYRAAAQAYEMALKHNPVDRDLKFQRGLALALAADTEAFYAYIRKLSMQDPRLTYDLLSRQECRAYLDEPRFKRIQQEAFDQYLD